MKNALFTLFLGLIFQNSMFSQLEKGNFLIGGSASFSHIEFRGSDLNNTFIRVSPSTGFFIEDRFALGASLGLSISINPNLTQTIFSVEPYARYYFPQPFWLQLQFRYQYNDLGSDNMFISPRVGYAFFLNETVSIDPSIGASFPLDGEENFTGTQFLFFLGIQVYLSKKGKN
ncbi:MAG: hypothetical protein AAGA10_08255 [Bacteroidota bacterium]